MLVLSACQKKSTVIDRPPSLPPPPSPSVRSEEGAGNADDGEKIDTERSEPTSERVAVEETHSSVGYGEETLNDEIEPLKKEMEKKESRSRESDRRGDTKIIARYEKLKASRKKSREAAAGEAYEASFDGAVGYAGEGVGTAATRSSRFTGAAAASVKAATHDDNEEIVSYREFCRERGADISPYRWDVSERYIIKVTHADSSTAFGRDITIADATGTAVFSARTPASGEIVLLPEIDLENYRKISDYTLAVDNGKPVPLEKGREDLLSRVLVSPRKLPEKLTLQICFLMDATGSMGDEIEQLQDVIFSIHSRIISLPSKPEVLFSLVAYRDRKDTYPVKGHHFTGSIDRFQVALESLRAGGGGDYPEDIEAGFNWCLDSLSWNREALKFIFLVADAPPHLDKKERSYLYSARQCRQKGVMVCPVGASGLDIRGEYVFRQIALVTRGQFVFLHYGEKGESDGRTTAADPGKVSHHTGSNYNARRLDDIVVDIVSGELSFLTPGEKVVRDFPEPEQQRELLDIRMRNLLQQVVDVRTPLGGKSIVLSPFSIADSTLAQLSEYLWGTALEKLPGYTDASIIERQRLKEVLKEQAISLSGLTGEKDAMDIGKLLNADYLILSRLHFLGAMRLCHMRLVDCTTGAIVRAARVRL